ncbi:MAG: AAA family ATPase [Patescibacteria group bacterium]
MKLSDAYRIVKDSIKQNTPIMLWGPPGIGKSSLIHQIAEELGRNVLDLRLAQLEPTDLRGVPMPDTKIGRARWYLPAFWPNRAEEDITREVEKTDKNGKKTVEIEIVTKKGCCPEGSGIVFLDEIEKAPISVKNASLQLVLDRAIGTYVLPDDWAIVCAGNREEDGCFSAPLGSALSNRMIHLDIEADVDAWAMWARDNDVLEDVIGFLHFKPELLYKQTEEHAFPTPRSWVMASKLSENSKNVKEQKELISAAVGRGAAQEYTVWQNVYKSVDPEAIFNGQMPNFDGKDQSFKYAVALAVAFALRKRKTGIKKIEDNVAAFLNLLSPELRVCLLRQLTLSTMEAMAKSPAFKKNVSEIMKIAV